MTLRPKAPISWRWLRVVTTVVAFSAVPTVAAAQRGGGPPITLTFETVGGGLPVSGEGTNTASLDFGTVSAFKPVGPGITRSNTATDYTLSAQFGVRVTKGGGTSPDYTLRARLAGAHPLTWRINGVVMGTSYATVAFTQPYAATLSHALEFVVPLTSAPGGISTTFDVLAISN